MSSVAIGEREERGEDTRGNGGKGGERSRGGGEREEAKWEVEHMYIYTETDRQ